MENELTCGICLDLYSEPLILPCSHNFCKKCLLDLFHHTQQRSDDRRARHISCPKCRREIPFDEWSSVLPVNKTLDNVVKIFKSTPQNVPRHDFCSCPRHSKVVSLYCQTCKRTVCEDCVLEAHSGFGHHVKTIDDIVEEEKDKARANIQELDVIKETVTSRDTNILNLIENSKTQEQRMKKIVEDQFSMILTAVNLQKSKVLEEVTAEFSGDQAKLKKLAHEYKSLAFEISFIRKGYADSLRETDPKRQLRDVILKVSTFLAFKSTSLPSIPDDVPNQDGRIDNLCRAQNAIRKLRWIQTSEENVHTEETSTQTEDLVNCPATEDYPKEELSVKRPPDSYRQGEEFHTNSVDGPCEEGAVPEDPSAGCREEPITRKLEDLHLQSHTGSATLAESVTEDVGACASGGKCNLVDNANKSGCSVASLGWHQSSTTNTGEGGCKNGVMVNGFGGMEETLTGGGKENPFLVHTTVTTSASWVDPVTREESQASSSQTPLFTFSSITSVTPSHCCGVGARPKVRSRPQVSSSSGAGPVGAHDESAKDERRVGAALKEGLSSAVYSFKSLCRARFSPVGRDESLDLNANGSPTGGAASQQQQRGTSVGAELDNRKNGDNDDGNVAAAGAPTITSSVACSFPQAGEMSWSKECKQPLKEHNKSLWDQFRFNDVRSSVQASLPESTSSTVDLNKLVLCTNQTSINSPPLAASGFTFQPLQSYPPDAQVDSQVDFTSLFKSAWAGTSRSQLQERVDQQAASESPNQGTKAHDESHIAREAENTPTTQPEAAGAALIFEPAAISFDFVKNNTVKGGTLGSPKPKHRRSHIMKRRKP